MVHFERLTRREALAIAAAATSLASTNATAAQQPEARLPADPRRVEGLLIGSLIGDALGGPVEFQPPELVHALPGGPKKWLPGERLDEKQIEAARSRFVLRGYHELRPVPEPYAHWASDAPPGTVTDDSRHKMVLAHLLRSAQAEGRTSIGPHEMAQAYLSWGERAGARKEHQAINREWMHEVHYAAKWVLGVREIELARPPERLWNGLPTCMGQMALLPLAAAFPGDPDGAFRAAFSLAFFDNGWGKDLNAGLVAALAVALTLPDSVEARHSSWKSILEAMLTTDPYRQADVPWCERAASRWVRTAERIVGESRGEPARLYAALDEEFAETTKWEAQVPVVAMLAAAQIADYDPLASMQVCLEWGHDTDSYVQLLGAFVGALHGPEVFPQGARDAVAERLESDYGESLGEWVELFSRPVAVTPA